MIGKLTGTLAEKQAPHLLIDVNGVGYEVLAPMTTIFTLGELNTTVALHTHLAVSENAHTLYGFATKNDREVFRTLIKVNGVGPKMALAILSGMEINDLVNCVAEGNVAALVKVPGVGKKTAERLLVDLKDRLKGFQGGATPLAAMEAAAHAQEALPDYCEEAEGALIALGYKPAEACKMVASALKENAEANTEELIRLALKAMVR
ncbi:MAG: Holliday junction branch migration protein RuvA [Cellvibrionaceae bacterium]